MIKLICFAIVFLTSFNVKAEKFRNDIDCSAMFSEDYIFARFPILNPKKNGNGTLLRGLSNVPNTRGSQKLESIKMGDLKVMASLFHY